VLGHILDLLNRRHQYGLELFFLSVDEGITGYRDDSLDVGDSHPGQQPFLSFFAVREAERGALWHPAEGCELQGAVWLVYGRDCEGDRLAEQLYALAPSGLILTYRHRHLLRGFPASGSRQRSSAAEGRQNRYWPQRRRHSRNCADELYATSSYDELAIAVTRMLFLTIPPSQCFAVTSHG
jgi:hypothetical protein